jgi:hypothetical protein
MYIFPKRMVRQGLFLLGYRFKQIRYKRLNANYDTFWTSDSDACNSIDPHDAILWFLSHGFDRLSIRPTGLFSWYEQVSSFCRKLRVSLGVATTSEHPW